MIQCHGKLLEIIGTGKILVITDLHGNLTDLEKYQRFWREYIYEGHYVVLTGDVIHPVPGQKDNSLEVLEIVKQWDEEHANFNLLMGNHEFSHLSGMKLYKGGMEQREEFERQIQERYRNIRDYWGRLKMKEYCEYFQNLPVAVKTSNQVFISHAGPSKLINSMVDIERIVEHGFNYNSPLIEMLFNRPGDYDCASISSFLEKMECKAMVVGHTPVKGYELFCQKQMILSSSDGLYRKAYLELDLETDIDDARDLEDMVKFL
ncbi:MAG: Calcineurin-like phosphoesterase [Methanobacterium sp. PtaB.Bin024]|jgi:serine/threonine-protein phosphatase PP1 catalytic subunit|nr:MAG: Calcineurin-like phosphoesterase [Methanobacterium sp. PtaB.Bin024]